MGVGMRINTAMGNQLILGILNMLQQMGMWNDKVHSELMHTRLFL
jgi:hypothetical protein